MLPSWEPLWPYRAVLAVDARNFSALDSKGMQQVNADILPLLSEALSASNVSAQWQLRVFGQYAGDSYVAGMDPEVLPALVGCFPGALRQALGRRRADSPASTPLQLRVSIHVGPLPHTGLGVPMVHTHRLLDDDALRTLLNRANPEITNTAVIISQRVYEDVFESGCVNGDVLPDQFMRHLVKVKKFQQPAYVHIPGFDWRLADPDIFEPLDTTDAATEQPAPAPGASPQLASTAPGTVSFSHTGEHGIQAYNLHLNGDQAIPVPITESDADYKASQDGRFVPPRNTDQWEAASKLLDEYGVIVLCAAQGNGRRTAAIRLLSTVTSPPPALFDLDPEWSKPSVRPLPKEAGMGCILDLSDLAEQPGERLGTDLVSYGAELRKNNSFLVILATPADWYGHWAEPTLPFTARLESPDARALVTAEFRASYHGDRVTWLDRTEFAGIWKANPSARAAWRLADRLLRASGPEQIQTIVDEFGDWHREVEKLLSRNRATGGDAQLLSTRVTVWAGALLHGGQRRSVIKAADDLLTRLGLERHPVNVLADATTSSRLDAAEITRDGDRAFHDTQKEGLPAAILRHLWDEFPTQHELLRRWAIGIAADRTVPEEDARLITTALWKLAAHRHDRAILDGLASDLKGPRRVLAVEALTKAAGDAEFGRYVRDRLRQWMDAKNPSDDKVDLVIEICAGTWGIHQPTLALTRLGKAAGHKTFGSATVVNAFQQLALQRPDDVRKAVDQWLTDLESRPADEPLRRQTLGSFLALVSSDEGTDLILNNTRDTEARLRIIHAWQKLLCTDDAVDAVVRQLSRWHERFQENPDRREAVVDVLADIFAPPSLRPGLDRLMVTEEAAILPFWREVLVLAANRYQASKEASTP